MWFVWWCHSFANLNPAAGDRRVASDWQRDSLRSGPHCGNRRVSGMWVPCAVLCGRCVRTTWTRCERGGQCRVRCPMRCRVQSHVSAVCDAVCPCAWCVCAVCCVHTTCGAWSQRSPECRLRSLPLEGTRGCPFTRTRVCPPCRCGRAPGPPGPTNASLEDA